MFGFSKLEKIKKEQTKIDKLYNEIKKLESMGLDVKIQREMLLNNSKALSLMLKDQDVFKFEHRSFDHDIKEEQHYNIQGSRPRVFITGPENINHRPDSRDFLFEWELNDNRTILEQIPCINVQRLSSQARTLLKNNVKKRYTSIIDSFRDVESKEIIQDLEKFLSTDFLLYQGPKALFLQEVRRLYTTREPKQKDLVYFRDELTQGYQYNQETVDLLKKLSLNCDIVIELKGKE